MRWHKSHANLFCVPVVVFRCIYRGLRHHPFSGIGRKALQSARRSHSWGVTRRCLIARGE